ncbi:MAG TPA: tetratricopeptide repeat protein [Pyrinomonadaceae bacterium]
MRQKRLSLLAVLLVMFACGVVVNAQTSREDAEQLIRRGNERYTRAEYTAAIEEYGRVPKGAGEIYAQSLYNIGVCYYELWRTEDAIRMYRLAIDARQGRYPKALYALGVALKDAGRASEAKEAFGQALLTSGGKHAMAHYMLGLLAMSEGDYKAAAALFKDAIDRFKDRFPASHNNLGVTLAHLGRLSEAEREFEIALRQADGEFDEAAHNLKLCRSLATKAQAASLKVVETSAGLNK